jgi:hypothetical protein
MPNEVPLLATASHLSAIVPRARDDGGSEARSTASPRPTPIPLPVHHGHHLRRIPFASHFDRTEAIVGLLQIRFGELHG